MNPLFERLHQAGNAATMANDLKGRSPFCAIGLVTKNNDPQNRRRIKATLQSKGGVTETDWLLRLVASPYDDPPLPRIGQTVIVFFIDGNPHQGVYFGAVTNATNNERSLTKPVEDDGRTIEGDQIEAIEQDRNVTIQQNDALTVSGNVTINADGSISITGATITITGGTIDLVGDVAIDGSGTINGSEIMVIGGLDNDGDVMVASGQ